MSQKPSLSQPFQGMLKESTKYRTSRQRKPRAPTDRKTMVDYSESREP